MKHIPAYPLQYEFSRRTKPKAVIESGESISLETEDALSGQIRTPTDRRDKTTVPFSNPVAGPVFVKGALPGDTLAVKIESIIPRDGQCATYTGNLKHLAEWLGNDVPHGAHVCPIRDGMVHWSDEITIPYEPMLGCIGTAPHWGTPTTLPAGPHGGNMDIIETAPGNTVYLPVFVEGGLLYIGDAHAAMGHGELSATGLEMASNTVVAVELIRGKTIAGPRIESREEIMTIATGAPMERAVAEAYAHLILWMEEEYGWNRWKAYDILTHVGRVSIGYYAIGTVAAKIQKRYLNGK